MLDGVSLFVFITHLHCTQPSLSLYILTNTFDHIHLLTSASGIQGQLPVANAPAAPHLDIHNGTFDQRREALHARFAQARALRAQLPPVIEAPLEEEADVAAVGAVVDVDVVDAMQLV